uniref:Eukaryotic translation initiation factor 5A n=1 Tax=Arion vulgaris TaxID=1028688 RepID=A0A0B6ZCQ5_9EUPU
MQNQSSSTNYVESHDDNFEKGDAGASLTFPVQCSALKKGGHVNIKDRPCRIVDIHSSKVGKHGHCKVTITGLDLFTDKRYQTVNPSSHTMDVPVVARTDYILVDIGQYMSLMDDKGILRYDLPAPEGEIGKTIRDKVAANADGTIEVTVMSAMGEELVVNVKTGKE